MTCSPQGKHEPLRIRLRIRLRPVAAAGGGSGNKGDKDEEGSYSDSSGDVAVERTPVDFIKSC